MTDKLTWDRNAILQVILKGEQLEFKTPNDGWFDADNLSVFRFMGRHDFDPAGLRTKLVPVKVTVFQIEELLGYPIEIVKG